MNMSSPTKEIYSLRRSFSIIGLTGRMGSGNLKIANYLSQSKENFFNNSELRNPSDLKILKDDFESNLFKRKYTICYNFYSQNYIKYEVIDYKKALLLYVINYYSKDKNPIEALKNLIRNWFVKSEKADSEFPDIKFDETELDDIVNQKNFMDAIIKLNSIDENLLEIKNEKNFIILTELFFDKDSTFNQWCNYFIKQMENKNHYLRTFFFHKIANNVRSTGDPSQRPKENSNRTTDYVYTIAKTINRLIKAYKSEDKTKQQCHLVINSLKNSLEIMFFKERYSAFYLMTINNQNNYKSQIRSRFNQDEENIELTVKKLIDLDSIENCSSAFAKGNFTAPDVENCIQKAEIHLRNLDLEQTTSLNDFFSVKEQIIKILSLLQQPGIITPSNQERCMLVAYNSKFNSGCISRQVGAVLTDTSFAIKAVGWNDVPKKSITCLLKNAEELVEDNIEIDDSTYSDFEKKSSNVKYEPNTYKVNEETIYVLNNEYIGKNFNENLRSQLPNFNNLQSEGKNCTFCFKTMHNKFEGEKNQVHTRSLHAEENAMLQITKYGGQGILNGKLFTTASPCELCAKKAYQIGIKEVYFIDPYPGISMDHVLKHGNSQPELIPFHGIIGKSFNKLYEPLMSYKDELSLYKD